MFRSLYVRFEGITWYVQAVLNKVWESGKGLVDVSQIESTTTFSIGPTAGMSFTIDSLAFG